jgi:hypothetical protein
VYHAGARGYGLLLAGGGAGALIGALGMASVKDIRAKGRVMLAAGGALCVTLAAFALVRSLAAGVALVTAVGVAATAFTTMIATMIQLRVPGPLRGRVVALYVSTLIGLPSLGSLGIAALAKALQDGARARWAAPLRATLDALGVGRATRALAAAAGAPRALVVGAVVLGVALLAAAPRYMRVESDEPRGSA